MGETVPDKKEGECGGLEGEGKEEAPNKRKEEGGIRVQKTFSYILWAPLK